MLLVDYRKAFDMVDHELLLKKLEVYGIVNQEFRWCHSYLSSRKQAVHLGGAESCESPVKHGVPQGSILGPLFFILFIKDLPLHVSSQIDLYADDTTITNSSDFRNISQLELSLNTSKQNVFLASRSCHFRLQPILLRISLPLLDLRCWNSNSIFSEVRRGDCGENNRYVTFLTPARGFYLEGHVFLNLTVELNWDCQNQCALARECVSYNIGPSIKSKMACELSNSDHLQHPKDLKPRHNWNYRGTKNICATKPCRNNEKCYMGYTEKKYVCVCPAYYHGQNCEKAVASCSYIRKSDPTARSGSYVIDPDGEERLVPFSVYCDMTDKNGVGVTVISHDSERKTLVSGYEDPGSYSLNIRYNGVRFSQLASLTTVSSQCEQFISYQCNHSVLRLYKKKLYGWWTSRDSKKMVYWGGASPGSGKCACGMNNSCADSSRHCNCDKNDYAWREDSGLLTDKTKLPVKQLRFGDTGDNGEEGYHTLGKLKCYGMA